MSRFEAKAKVIDDFWVEIFGKNPTGQCCIAMSVLLLGCLYAVALLWLIPLSVYKAFRHAKDRVAA